MCVFLRNKCIFILRRQTHAQGLRRSRPCLGGRTEKGGRENGGRIRRYRDNRYQEDEGDLQMRLRRLLGERMLRRPKIKS